MPLLIKGDTGWAVSADQAPAWKTLDDGGADYLLLANDAEPGEEVLGAHSIAIEFPAFNDGRGLSLAVMLRTRLGFKGQICAVGEVHEDLLHYMDRCGFDAVLLGEDRDTDIALRLIAPYKDHYQGCVNDPRPAFRRVSRGSNA